MYLFRCLNPKCADDPNGKLGHDFYWEAPICPKCGIDGRSPKYGRFMEVLTTIHYDPPEGIVDGVGKNIALCNGKTSYELGMARPLEQVTGEPGSVTCPACKAHDDFPKSFIESAPERVRPWVGDRLTR
jgi:hypothetical protein